MTEEQFEHIENSLRSLALYVYNCKDQQRRSSPKNFLNYVKPKNPPMQEDFEVVQLNKLKNDEGVLDFTEKEIYKMPQKMNIKNKKISKKRSKLTVFCLKNDVFGAGDGINLRYATIPLPITIVRHLTGEP